MWRKSSILGLGGLYLLSLGTSGIETANAKGSIMGHHHSRAHHVIMVTKQFHLTDNGVNQTGLLVLFANHDSAHPVRMLYTICVTGAATISVDENDSAGVDISPSNNATFGGGNCIVRANTFYGNQGEAIKITKEASADRTYSIRFLR